MRKRNWIRTILLCAVLILVVLMIYGGLRIMESTVFSKDQPEEITRKTVTRDGVEYFPRQDLCTVLIMGIDRQGKAVPSQEPNHGNAVDMVTLLIFDKKDETVSLLSLNRDMIVEMPRLNEYGRETGTRFAQLALSHTYGRGMEDSCNNTKKTVSNLLYGIPIDYYLSMSMDAIEVLNDAVGGVAVTVEDDFSKVDPSIQIGTMTLNGEQALRFVQARAGVGDQLNLSRIRRQQEYMQGFLTAFKEKAAQSSSFLAKTYDEVSDYIVTDMSVSVLSRLMEDYSQYELKDVISLKGENKLEKEHYAFYVDEEALDTLVLELFFAPK